jgi:hypothetical protein
LSPRVQGGLPNSAVIGSTAVIWGGEGRGSGWELHNKVFSESDGVHFKETSPHIRYS